MESYSVLMSLYKNESPDNFEECLLSLLGQTVKPEQIVVVLDGPITDKLNIVLKKYSCSLEIVPLKSNHGLGYALSVGIYHCRNKFVARMDTDDVALPERMEMQLNFLLENKNVAVVGGYIMEFGNRRIDYEKKVRTVPVKTELVRKFSKYRNPMNHMTVMFNKESVIEVGNYKDFKGFEDYNLWVRMIKNNYILTNIPKVLVNVRTGSQMISRRRGLKYLYREFKFQCFLKHIRFIGNATFLRNLSVRCTARILPNKLLKYAYNNFARKGSG